jgi:hypothetical protein
MRPHIIFCCFALLFICHESLCQAWQPVSKTTHAHYQLGPSKTNLHTVKVDSFYIVNNDTTFVLTKTASCFSSEFPGHEITQLTDKGFRLSNGSRSYFIYPGRNIDAEWIYDSVANISAKITAIGFETVMAGIDDSVKTISLSTGDAIRITRNFGILSIAAMDGSLRYFTLTGLPGLKKGFLMPDFFTIFNFDVGDVFETSEFDGPSDYRDSYTKKFTIKEKTISENCYRYTIEGVVSIESYRDYPWVPHGSTGTTKSAKRFTDVLELCLDDYPELSGNTLPNTHIERYDEKNFAVVYSESRPTDYYPWYAQTHNFVNGLGKVKTYDNNSLYAFNLKGSIKNGDTTGIISTDSAILSQTYPNEYLLRKLVLSNSLIKEKLPPNSFIGKLSCNNSHGHSIIYKLITTRYSDRVCDNENFYIRNDSLFSAKTFRFSDKNTYTIEIEPNDQHGGNGLLTHYLSSTFNIYILTDATGCPKPVISPHPDGFYVGVFPGDQSVTSYQWYFNGQLISNGRENISPSRAPGIYTVQAIYRTGCTAKSDPFILERCALIPPTLILSYEHDPKLLYASRYYMGETFTWYKDGIPLPTNEVNHLLRVSESGSYTVTAAYPDGCTMTSAPYGFCPELTITFDSLILTAPESSFYNWSFNGLPLEQHTRSIAVQGTGTYKVTVSCGEGSSQLSFQILPCMEFLPAVIVSDGPNLTTTKGIGYRWFVNDKELPDTTQSIPISEPGIYQVYIFFSESCYKISEPVNITITDTEVQNADNFSISYDAVTEILNINTTKSQMLKMKIFDCTGRLCLNVPGSTNSNEANLSLQNYPKGLYIIHLYHEKGMMVKKILK